MAANLRHPRCSLAKPSIPPPRRNKGQVKKIPPAGTRTAIVFLTASFSEPTMRPFVLELDELQNKILEMGGLVETSIHNSIRSLVERDDALMVNIWECEE